MKKVTQPYIRKVYGQNNQQQDIQMNTVRKINSLLSSGAVSVTGPTQGRILKQQPTRGTIVTQIGGSNTTTTAAQHHQIHIPHQRPECYVCGESTTLQNSAVLTETLTNVSNTKLPNKIGRVVGDKFMVIISVDDVICKRCLSMFNHMDRLESELDRIKTNILNLINKKYGISDGDTTVTKSSPAATISNIQPLPAKVQRLTTTTITQNNARKSSNGEDEEMTVTRKIAVPQLQAISSSARDSLENQLTSIFDSTPENSSPIVKIQQVQPQQQIRQNTTITPIVQQPATTAVQQLPKKQPIKIYKCMSCDFKTTDLKHFQPHYETCKQQNGHRCKHCKRLFPNANALKVHTAEKHSAEFTCSICSINFQNEPTFKKHMETNHPDVKTIETSTNVATIYNCNMCSYKTPDKQNYDEHLRKHVKVKPFKCRICSMRFESREQAAIHAKAHQPDYFKCGKCAMSFPQRDLLMKHFETHKQIVVQQQAQKSPQQQQQQQQQQAQQQIQTQQISHPDLTTQKLLQETIDEALRESGDLDSKIHFFTCNICSLTFIQENYYNQHMETHKRENNKKITTVTTTSSQSLIRQDVRNSNSTVLHAQPNQISDSDIESMFEKMHSEKVETEGGGTGGNSNENLVITKQENSVGGITFNITIPQQGIEGNQQQQSQEVKTTVKQEGGQIGMDMPVLDQGDDQEQIQYQVQSGPVSMPSLDDDAESSQPSNTEQIPMDLEDMQNAGDGQIKFILNEDGQILQLDNHIITTDDDGNQILVQGTDSEQIQQLLQSVGVLQAGEGDGETYQMIQGENNQMIIVQGDNNEAQLIDASMLNEDGHLVIQQHEGDEMPEEMHIVNEDGVQVPVSIAFHHQQQDEQHHDETGEETAAEQQEQHQQEQQDEEEHQQFEEEQLNLKKDPDAPDNNEKNTTSESMEDQETVTPTTTATTTTEGSSTANPVTSTTGEVFFNLEDLMQQPEQK